jgi:hypothetical protein
MPRAKRMRRYDGRRIGPIGIVAFGGGADEWSPPDITTYVGSPYSFAALRDAGALWQNTAMTVPAVADGDAIRRAVVGGYNWDAPSDAARPLLWDEGGGKWSAFFDGADDTLAVTQSFAGDFEFLACISRDNDASNQHTLSDTNQTPTVKRYGAGEGVGSTYQAYDGFTLVPLVGSDPGASYPTPWHLVGLSRASATLYARVGATDYTPGLTTSATFGDTALAIASKGGPNEFSSLWIVGLALSSARLSSVDRALLADYLTALAP